MPAADDPLLNFLNGLRARLAKRKGAPPNEQTTKMSFITPLIQALGWDTGDQEEVVCEYRLRGKDLPVDYALMVDGAPLLIVEAKGLGQNIDDRKWALQALTYTTQVGAPWAALTNGDDWSFYNCTARAELDDRLFRRVSIATTAMAELVETLQLISKAALSGKRIDRAWERHHTERLVREGLARLFDRQSPSPRVVSLLVKGSRDRLKPNEVQAALRRANVSVDFPAGAADERPMPPVRSRAAATAPATPGSVAPGRSPTKRSSAGSGPRPSLVELIRSGTLHPPTEIVGRGRQKHLTATIESDGTVTFGGQRYDSLSSAGAAARAPFAKGKASGKGGPSTNGWDFWRVADPTTGNLATMDAFARRAR